MNRTVRPTCLALLASLACDATPERDPADYACELPDGVQPELHPRAEEYARALESVVGGTLPGAVWLVRDKDGTWAGAVGSADLDLGVPMRSCHRTRIASITKSVVATAALELVEDGTLGLDDTVGEHLAQRVRRDTPRADAITVRHLLSHSSGLDDYLDVSWGIELFNDPTRTWTTQEMLERGLAKELLFAPGARHEYANTNYVLMSEVIEGATGRPHEQIMRERVFEPLGMREASYVPDDFDFRSVVRGYFDLYGDGVLVDGTDTYAAGEVTAAGGVIANAFDLAELIDGTIRGGGLIPEELRSEALQMLPFSSDYGFSGYGLGFERWETDHGIAYGHTGQEFGYLAFAYHFPEPDLTFVFWANASSISVPTDDNLTGDVVGRILPELVRVALQSPAEQVVKSATERVGSGTSRYDAVAPP